MRFRKASRPAIDEPIREPRAVAHAGRLEDCKRIKFEPQLQLNFQAPLPSRGRLTAVPMAAGITTTKQ